MPLAGLIALGPLIWSASGMTASLRIALAVVWEAGARPAYVRAKLRDVATLGVLATLVLAPSALVTAGVVLFGAELIIAADGARRRARDLVLNG